MNIYINPIWLERTVPLAVFGDSFPTTTVALGVAMLVLGYLIRFHQMTELIAGINPEMVADEEHLANLVGGTLFVMSLLTFVYAVVTMQGLAGETISTAYEVALVALVLVMMVRARTI
jgi:hypothetical protein